MANKKPKRRIMRHFKLSEISAVDKPAQEGAKATLMKRNGVDGGESLEILLLKRFLDTGDVEVESISKSVSPTTVSGLTPYFKALSESLHSIASDGTLSDTYKLDMMKASAGEFLEYVKQKVPNIEKYLQDSLGEGQEDMTLRKMQKQMDQLDTKLNTLINKMAPLFKQGPMGAVTTGAGQGKEDEAADRLRAMLGGTGASAEKAEDDVEDDMDPYSATEKADDTEPGRVTTEGEEEDVIAGGSARAIGEGDGEADPEAATGEEDMAGGEKTKEMAIKRLGKRDRVHIGEDSVNINGEVFSKSVVGDNLFTVLKAQQVRIDELAKAAGEERELREVLEFAQVAKSSLGHLPGTIEQKAGLLHVLSKSLGKEDQDLISKMLQANNTSMKSAFTQIGNRGEDVKKAAANGFAKRMDEVRSNNPKLTRTEVMQKARKDYPQEYAEYQGRN